MSTTMKTKRSAADNLLPSLNRQKRLHTADPSTPRPSQITQKAQEIVPNDHLTMTVPVPPPSFPLALLAHAGAFEEHSATASNSVEQSQSGPNPSSRHQQPFNQIPPQSGKQPIEKMSRKERKKIERDIMRKAKKKAAKNGTPVLHHSAVLGDLGVKPSVSEPRHVQHIQQNHVPVIDADAMINSVQTVPLPAHALPEPPRRQPVQLASGEAVNLWETRQQKDVSGSIFTPINNIDKESTGVKIIGVVKSVNPAYQCGHDKDWTMSMKVKNPTGDITVNCFTGKYKEWLPDVEPNEIIILCGLRGKSHETPYRTTMTVVGYKNKLQWLIYNPTRGKFRSKPSNPKVPEREIVEKQEHTPFLNYADFPNIEKDCLDLWEWHEPNRHGVYEAPALNASSSNSAVREESRPPVVSNTNNVVYHLGEPSTYSSAPVRRGGRQHHLLSEVTPKTDPGGFFDCTVEICHGAQGSNGLYILFVTDYTAPLDGDTSSKKWCESRLQHLVLKVELNDSAATDGPTMLKGSFYSLQNCRMKYGRTSGLIECVIRERKARKLDPETDQTEHLRKLLKRKRDFEGNSRIVHKLLSDVHDEGMYLLTVEVLRVGLDGPKRPFLLITDYTKNARLPACNTLRLGGNGPPNGDGLDHRILRVSLENGQEDMVQTLEEGKLYSITNMRIRENPEDKRTFFGILSGKDISINPVNTRRPSEEAKALERRKPKWQNQSTAGKQADVEVPPPVLENKQPEASLLRTRKDCMSIKDALSVSNLKERHIFKCIGKVVSSYPTNLRDFTIRWCANCGKDMTMRTCIPCNDMSHEKWKFRFSLDVVDEEGTRMTLIVSNPKNPVLKGCEATDLHSTKFAHFKYFKLQMRIRQLIGDASEAFNGDFSNGDYSSSMVYHVIASMEEVGDGFERVYYLVGFEDL